MVIYGFFLPVIGHGPKHLKKTNIAISLECYKRVWIWKVNCIDPERGVFTEMQGAAELLLQDQSRAIGEVLKVASPAKASYRQQGVYQNESVFH
jgi:hypothetical protein